MRAYRWPALLLALAIAGAGLVGVAGRSDLDASHRPRPSIPGARTSATDRSRSPSRSFEKSSDLDPKRLGPPETSPGEEVDKDTLIVRLRQGVTSEDIERIVEGAGARTESTIPQLNAVVVSVDAARRDDVARALELDQLVERVDENQIRHISADPDDEGYFDQGHLFVSRLPVAWEVTKGSSTLDIAIVDTGVDLDHPDLSGRIVAGYDFANDDTSAQDDEGHGTMVAGIAAAKTNNTTGVAGVAWNARIMPVKVMDGSGSGTDDDIVAGILWAADHGAEVINLSLGGPGANPILDDAVAYAMSKGAVVVAAAGNEGTSEPSYPAAIPDVVAVGATDLAGVGDVADFSNFGSWVDIVAPGTQIVSTAMGGDYAVGDGTSFASPIVAGTALLVRAKNPTWTPAQVASKLSSSAADRGPDGIDDSYGHGLLDAYSAVGGRTAASPPIPAGDALEPNDVPDRAKPVPSSSTAATISPEGDVDWYYVDAGSRGTITFRVTAAWVPGGPPPLGNVAGLDAVIDAFSPDHTKLGHVNNLPVGVGETIALPVASPGRYYFRVSSAAPTTSDPYGVSTSFDAALPFESPEGYAAAPGVWPGSLSMADVTGDGLEDAIFQTSYGSDDPEDDYKLFVYPRLADGTLGTPSRYATNTGYSSTTGDLDGDGDIDIAIGGVGGIDLYHQADGSLSGPTPIAGGIAGGHVRIADLNGDGNVDMVAQGPQGAGATNTTVVLQLVDGVWTATHSQLPEIWTFEIRELTGDGRPDVVGLAGNGSDKVRVLEQQADGSFVAHDYVGSFGYITSFSGVEVADINNDGRPDVVASVGGNSPGSRLNVFHQSADGTLGSPVVLPSLDAAGAVVAADMNADGLTDIVTLHGNGYKKVGIYFQTVGGGLTAEELHAVPSRGGSLSVVDLSGDARPDLAIVDHYTGLVLIKQLAVRTTASPMARSVTPSDRGTGVAATSKPVVTLSREVDATSITAATIRLIDGVTGSEVPTTRTYDTSTRKITLSPSQPLKVGNPYLVAVAGLKGLDGSGMTMPFGSRFTVATNGLPTTRADVNGDGYDDVIVGAPDEDFGTKTDAGVVHVLYGSATGAKTSGSQMFTQDTSNVPDSAEAGDRFGAAIATGDVNKDGYDDVAIGVPGENIGSINDGGAVHLLLGSSTGLRATGSQFWTQDSSGVPDAAETGDKFGSALAFGDFDNAVGDDLAIGSPGESVGSLSSAGAVHVLSGRSGGLSSSGAQLWTQQSIDGFAATGNKFGASIAAADFDGDTHDDLAIGAPYEDIALGDEGTITLMRGTIVGLRPIFTVFSEILTQTPAVKSERFGSALAAEDFGGLADLDGYDDLAVGSPGASSGRGRVDVLYSDWVGPIVGVRSTTQTGNGNQPEPGDAFGGALAAGRTKGFPYSWLAIAATGEDFGSVTNAGAVHVVTPRSWISSNPTVAAPITEDTANIPDSAENEDRFGTALRLLDVDKDGKPDMIVGVPNENVGSATSAGRIYVIRNAPSSSRTAQMLNQGSGGVPEVAQGGDRFGAALGG